MGFGGNFKKKNVWTKFSSLIRLISTLPLHYINILIVHFFRLVEIYSMTDHSLLFNSAKLLKLGLSKYAKKHVFGSFNLNNSEKKNLFKDIL